MSEEEHEETEAESEPPFERPPKRYKGRKPGPRPGKAKSPTKLETEQRRAKVEAWDIEGLNLHEIIERLRVETGVDWSRPTIYKDLRVIRERWETEQHKRSRSNVRASLERMSRKLYRAAMERKKPVTRRERDAEGKLVVTTVLIPDPDFAGANRAIERIAAMHGLNVTMLDGKLDTSAGLADLVGMLANLPPVE